jgi:hypothetical protein
MPKYLVYDKRNGRIVHEHETYDATSGTSIPSTREAIFALVDETLPREHLDIMEIGLEAQSLTDVARVNPETRALERHPRE